jgi:uncharacterized damage-inducible protein DinB
MRSRLVGFAVRYLAEYLSKIERATEGLGPDQIWWRANERSNSIANLLLHLDGNLNQWVVTGLLGEPTTRRRSAEFEARAGGSRDELLGRLARTVERCRSGIVELSDEDLAAVRRIQTYEVDGYAALFHAVEHMSYHTGQIVLLAKQLLPPTRVIEFYPQHRGE